MPSDHRNRIETSGPESRSGRHQHQPEPNISNLLRSVNDVGRLREDKLKTLRNFNLEWLQMLQGSWQHKSDDRPLHPLKEPIRRLPHWPFLMTKPSSKHYEVHSWMLVAKKS
jgi:hypothetical protein